MYTKNLTVGVFTHDFFPFIGGQGRHIYQMYQQNLLHKKTSMVVFSPAKNSLPNHVQLFPETGRSKLKNIEYSWKLNNIFEKLIEQYRLDLVHIHGGPGGLFLLKKLSVPVVYTTHHTYWQQYSYIRTQRWKYLLYVLEKQSYRYADEIICVSTDTQQILSKYYQVEKPYLHYIPNGIEQKNSIFANTNTYKKAKDILYVGRIDKRKGVDFLLKSMVSVNKIDPDIRLHIVGTGKDKDELEYFSVHYNLPVTFYNHVSDQDLQKIYTKVSAQIVPSIFEGFGISILEGMANGVPIIATNVDGIRSIVKHNYSGILVPYNDHDALADAIVYLLANSSIQKQLLTNAYRELPKYNWQKSYFQTVQLYEKIIH
ncbi:MAG: glycosyltransferase family 4 protein [Patescibacteria group bacterium]